MDSYTYSGTGTTANQNTNPDYERGYRDGYDHAIYTVLDALANDFIDRGDPAAVAYLKSLCADYRAYCHANQRP